MPHLLKNSSPTSPRKAKPSQGNFNFNFQFQFQFHIINIINIIIKIKITFISSALSSALQSSWCPHLLKNSTPTSPRKAKPSQRQGKKTRNKKLHFLAYKHKLMQKTQQISLIYKYSITSWTHTEHTKNNGYTKLLSLEEHTDLGWEAQIIHKLIHKYNFTQWTQKKSRKENHSINMGHILVDFREFSINREHFKLVKTGMNTE